MLLLFVFSSCTMGPGLRRDWHQETSGLVTGDAVPNTETVSAHADPARVDPSARDRMQIKKATLRVQVSNVEAALTTFLSKVEAYRGHLSRREGTTVTVRVPASAFDACLDDLRALGAVLQQTIESEDVTAEYQDLTIQIENARRSRDRLLALLERAEKVEDVLLIEEQLRRLTTEIERMEGHLKRLADQVSMSTVTASFVVPSGRTASRVRTPSRFGWINMLGVEHALRTF